ncbi:MAG: aldehyde dehydrogenase [Acholeplasma sp.]|nr:aldehyde dehydrogenase [Acholeplasma sp.]
MYQELLSKHQTFFQSNMTKNYHFRIQALKSLKHAIIKNEERIKEALYLDLGKSYNESYVTEIGVVLKEISFHIKHLKSMMKIKKVKTPLTLFPAKSYLYPEPLGTVLVISPWNYPFLLAINPLVGAISAGNTVILKPSEVATNMERVLQELINETFKEEYAKVVLGGVSETNTLLDNKFDYIFFTGSPLVGKIIMEKASKYLTPVTLELGGKSPAIIYESKDLRLTAKRIAYGKLLNAGQTCIAPDYVMIQKESYNDFIDYYKQSIMDFYGKDCLNNNDYPKIINKKHFERLMSYLDNEEIVYGGEALNNKLSPTVVKVNSLETRIMQEEIFGPILPIIIYDKFSEVYDYLRNKEKPLALYLFTDNKKIVKDVILKTSSGGVVINDTIMHFVNTNLGFGGVGNSGMGKYHGGESFKTFSHFKAIVNRKTWLDVKMRYHPLTDDKIKVIKKIMK